MGCACVFEQPYIQSLIGRQFFVRWRDSLFDQVSNGRMVLKLNNLPDPLPQAVPVDFLL